MAEREFAVHRDERGELVVVEGEQLDFAVRRVFTVSGVDGGGPRGGHSAGCTEVVVLVTGSADVHLRRPDGAAAHHRLDQPGRSVTVHAGDHVDYTLGGAGSVVMVLCDAPYQGA